MPTVSLDLMIKAYRYLLEEKAEMDGPTFDIGISAIISDIGPKYKKLLLRQGNN